MTSVSMALLPTWVARSCSLPSSSSRRSPTLTDSMISGCGRNTRDASPGFSELSSEKLPPAASCTAPSAKVSTRSFGPCRSTSTPSGCPSRFSTRRMRATVSASTSWLAWLILIRKTSAPARASSSIVLSSSLAGPRVARIFTRLKRLMVPLRLPRQMLSVRRQRALGVRIELSFERRLVARTAGRYCPQPVGVGELNHPVRAVLRIDLEKARTFVAAGEAILNPEDRKGFVAGAQEELAFPGPSTDIVSGIEVVVARVESAVIDGLAGTRIRDPPAFRLPAALRLVAEGDGDGVGRLVAHAQPPFLGLGIGGDRVAGWCAVLRLGARTGGRVARRQQHPDGQRRKDSDQQTTASQ